MLEFLAVAAHEGAEHAEPTAFGLQPGGFVALAMIVVIGIMLYAGVPKLIAKALDERIGDIRKQLDEAAKLRAEAEALKAEYAKKAAQADAEIATFMAAAERQAGEILDKAKLDANALIERHRAMAETKIAGAERAALAEIREKAATAAAAAARELIAAKHGATEDKALVDQEIAGI